MRFTDGTVLRLYRQTVEDFGLYGGMEMTPEVFQKLKTAAGEMSAKMRAVRIVSASNVSKQDLERRLIQKGEDPGQAKNAVQWMADMELLDDRKTAEQIVQRCIGKGYGAARAKQALYEKRIPKEIWDDVMADYPDQREHIEAFLEMRLRGSYDRKEMQKAIDALLRRGHGYAQIRSVLRTMQLDNDQFPEDL